MDIGPTQPAIICLGECLIDRIFDRQTMAEDPLNRFWQDFPGGGPANVATALAKLGMSVNFVGCLGSDEPGDTLWQTLQAAGVNGDGLHRHPQAPTRVVLVNRDDGGEPHFLGFNAPDTASFADCQIEPGQLDDAHLPIARALVMGTLGLAEGRTATTMALAKGQALQQDCPVIVDVNWRPVFWSHRSAAEAQTVILDFLADVTMVKLSQAEAQWLFDTTDPTVIQQQLPGTQIVLVTAGASGCAYATAHHHDTVPGFVVECEDTTGAGDAFLAGFLSRLLRENTLPSYTLEDIEAAVRLGCAVGAMTVSQAGAMTGQPSRQAVEAFLYLQR